MSTHPSFRPSAWNNSAFNERIFMKFGIWGFYENLSRKFEFHYNRTIIKGTLHEDKYTFFIISRSFLLRMRNVSDKSCRENHIVHFASSNFFSFFRKSYSLWDNMKKNIVERGRIKMTLWRMRIACWIPKVTNTHPQVV